MNSNHFVTLPNLFINFSKTFSKPTYKAETNEIIYQLTNIKCYCTKDISPQENSRYISDGKFIDDKFIMLARVKNSHLILLPENPCDLLERIAVKNNEDLDSITKKMFSWVDINKAHYNKVHSNVLVNIPHIEKNTCNINTRQTEKSYIKENSLKILSNHIKSGGNAILGSKNWHWET